MLLFFIVSDEHVNKVQQIDVYKKFDTSFCSLVNMGTAALKSILSHNVSSLIKVQLLDYESRALF